LRPETFFIVEGLSKRSRYSNGGYVIIEQSNPAQSAKFKLEYARKGLAVERHYDLFEILPDGSPIWRCAVAGHENAVEQLRKLAQQTPNEVRIIHLSSNTVIAVLNVPPA
jgi:hypothetical protein